MAIQAYFYSEARSKTRRFDRGNQRHEEAGLRIITQKRVRMTRERRRTLYTVHKGTSYFGRLIAIITSGPVVVASLKPRMRSQEIP